MCFRARPKVSQHIFLTFGLSTKPSNPNNMQGQTMPYKSNTKPNYFYAVISVALVLFLIGFFAIIVLYAQQLIKDSKENINIMVEIKRDTPPYAIKDLEQFIKEQSYTRQGTVAFTSKETAAEEMNAELGDFNKYGFQNPFYDVLNFNINAEHLNTATLSSMKRELINNQIVQDVYYKEGLVMDIERNVRKAGYFILGLGALFLMVAVTLIHNTIKLSLYANRFLIKNMQLVGASWSFISRPYLWKSVKNGFWSALLASLAIIAFVFLARFDLTDLQNLQITDGIVMLIITLFVLGILITFLSTYFVVNKYLKMRVDDLY